MCVCVRDAVSVVSGQPLGCVSTLSLSLLLCPPPPSDLLLPPPSHAGGGGFRPSLPPSVRPFAPLVLQRSGGRRLLTSLELEKTKRDGG